MRGDENEVIDTLRLVSFNIQAGSATAKYREYVTKGWQQLLPHEERITNLDAIARLLAEFDIAGLQELDDGSLRTGFLNQTQYLAERAGFPFWSHQPNRRVSKLARTCNGVLSRLRPTDVEDHKLPGRIPGRGALAVFYGKGPSALLVVIAHLALGRRSRTMQLDFLTDLIESNAHVVLMGDFNASTASDEMAAFLGRSGLHVASADLETFPSWRPQRGIDHIFISPSLEVRSCQVLPVELSDHRPIAVDLALPESCIPLDDGSR